MKKAALYIRVSTEEQARHGFSLGEQQHDLEEYAKQNNYAVVGVYADEGISARKTMSRRKELQRLLKDVEQGCIDVIVIKCLDRWFRNVADFYKVKEFLDKHNVEWECTQERYNTTTTEGRLMLNLKLSIAQNESDQTADRIRYINEGKRRRKEVASSRFPIGYSVDKDRHLVVNDDAQIIRDIYQYIAAGNSYRSSMLYVDKKYGRRLTGTQIRNIIMNRTYIGEYHGIEDFCEPIIERPLWDRVQEILKRRFRSSRVNRIYLFRGLIRCPECGNRMSAHALSAKSRATSLQYRCGIHKKEMACSFTGTINENKLEQWLLDNVQGLLEGRKYEIEQHYKQTSVDYHRKLDAVKGKLDRLKDLYVDGLIDKTTYIKDREPLAAQEREYTSMLAKQTVTPPASIKHVLEWDSLKAKYDELPRETKQSFWQSIIEEVTFEYKKVPGHHPERIYHVKFFW